MTQIAIVDGIYSDEAADYRSSYPQNLVPVPKNTGVSNGYLRPAEGIELFGAGPGPDRGGINWQGTMYRVMGYDLVRVEPSGAVVVLGSVGGTDLASMDYSFPRLIVVSNQRLYYYTPSGEVEQVTDEDLGKVIDAIFVDGYTMFTDGASIGVTDLNDPTSVNPLKYGSSEADPDPVVALIKLRNTPYAVNRYTMEAFQNVGGSLYPFQRIDGAQIQRGAIGTHCVCTYSMADNEVIAFVGSGRGEPPAVYAALNSTTTKLSTREIDTLLRDYNETELALCKLESRCDKTNQHLYLHLPDQTLVYDAAASAALGLPVWFVLTSGVEEKGRYRARNFVWAYDQWLSGDPTTSNLGRMVSTVSSHYGEPVAWGFGTAIIYNESRGAVFHMLELVCLPGRVALGAKPIIWTSYSVDGETWSMEESCSAGAQGARTKRLTWLQQGAMENWRIQRFRGTSDAHMSMARLEVQIEPLYV